MKFSNFFLKFRKLGSFYFLFAVWLVSVLIFNHSLTDGSAFKDFIVAAGTGLNIAIESPSQGINPNARPGKVISNALTIAFIIAMLIVLFFLILGAFQWITSGGEKERIGKARGTIVNALIGLAILAISFLIVKVLGGIFNVDVLTNLHIPSLDEGAVTP